MCATPLFPRNVHSASSMYRRHRQAQLYVHRRQAPRHNSDRANNDNADAGLTPLGLLLPGLPPWIAMSGVPWSSKHLVSQVKRAASRAISATLILLSACLDSSSSVIRRSSRPPALLACALATCVLSAHVLSDLQSTWVPCIAGSCS